MRKLGFIFIISFLLPQLVTAQHGRQLTQTIRGVVTDRASGASLPAITVQVSDTSIRTLTDEAGRFILPQVPLGRHSIYVSGTGYKSVVFEEVLVSAAKEVYLNVTLVEKIITLEEVEVTPTVNKTQPINPMAVLGAQMFSVEEASRFAGGMDDPARLASSYAGVATSNISNNGISIRGNAPSLLQWRLEGVEIPNPNHFADVDVLGGGFLSALSANVLANSDFFIGAFPAEYNNAVSGVFDMRLRNGNNQKYQHTFQLGVLGIDVASEGPISKTAGSSYLVNYRYSTTGLLEKLRSKEDMGGTLGYQDLNVKVNLPTKKAGTFSFWGIGLLDKVAPILEEPSEREYIEEGILSAAKQRSGAAGISHRYRFGNLQTSLKTTLAVTQLRNHIEEEFYDMNKERSPRTDLSARTTNWVVTSALTHKFSARHTNKTGVTFTHMQYHIGLDFTPFLGQPLGNIARSTEQVNLVSAYSNSLISLSNRFVLSAGVNVQHLTLTGKTTLEPRVGLRWDNTANSSLGVAYGLHSRMEKPDVYFVRDEFGGLPNKGLGFLKSHHFLFSYIYRISKDMHLKIEPYFQMLYDVPVTDRGTYSIINRKEFYVTEVLQSKGKGRNYGVDLTFSQYFNKGVYYLVTGSLFDSRYQAGNGHWYDTRYNRKFAVNGLIGKEWTFQGNRLGVNVKGTVLGGQRYTPVDEAATLDHPDHVVQYDESQTYSRQFSPMLIGDFSVSYTLNRNSVLHEFAVKSVNATGQKEYIEHRYNLKTRVVEPYWTATSMFNISYRFEF